MSLAPAKRRKLAPEQEILVNRMVMGGTAGIAVFFLAYDRFIFASFLTYLSLNTTLFLMQRFSIWPQERRWVAAIILDIGMAFGVMMHSASTMSFFYPLFLWVILGNGFRFGVKYLVIAATLAVLAFGAVVLSTDYWAPNKTLGYSLAAALIIIPAYCSTLIKKLSLAKEAAESANRAKGYFLASVSHELRTPLNAIIGYGNHLRQMGMPKNQHDMVEASVLAGEHLLHLIDQLIQIARSDSNTAEVVHRPLRLTELLTEIRDIMMVRADEKSLALQISAEPMSDQLVDGPADIIRNILLNLTGNAIKFTEAGAVSINGGFHGVDGNSRLWFSVTDTGIGIAADSVARIFEPFQQADDTVMNRFGGTGLGLAICQQLVTQVGGSIKVESTIGKGSCFTVEIPVSIAPLDTVNNEPADGVPTRLLALGRFDQELLARAQNAGNYVVKNMRCSDRDQLVVNLDKIQLDDYDIAMIDDHLAVQLADEDDIWARFAKEEVATVLVSHDVEPDLGEISLRAAFATVIPADASFDQLRSAIRIGCSFAHKPHFEERGGNNQTASQKSYRPRSILVADDNRTNRNILSAILETVGHTVTQVCDGDEMLEILENENFDIVLLDVNMPRLNGIDACHMWRQIEGNRSHLPIIGVTADATSETEARCLAAGMDFRLTKPINGPLLLSTIEKYCEDGSEITLPNASDDPRNVVVAIEPEGRRGAPEAIDGNHIAYLNSIGDGAFVQSMIDGFFEDAAESRSTMSNAVLTNDPALFRFAAHAFKSSSNNIGATQLAALCATLERVSQAEFETHGERHFRNVEKLLENAIETLRTVYSATLRAAS